MRTRTFMAAALLAIAVAPLGAQAPPAAPKPGDSGALPPAASQSAPRAAAPGEGLQPAAPADQATPQQQPSDIEELRRRLDVLASEIERMRSGEERERELSDERRRALGVAPSAAAAYRRLRGVSLAGYGEMLYENFAANDQSGAAVNRGSQIDALRLVLYAGYRFDDRFVFNSEIELEHATEISVEFAYVDYIASEAVAIRGGTVLLPMGLVNEFHEPTVFPGGRRPETESRIIPSTWRENGVGVVGSIGRTSYRAYVVNGMNAAGFSAAGLRAGRQKGGRAKAADLAFVGRIDVTPVSGVFAGGSVYAGGSDQGLFTVAGRQLDVATRIVEAHAQAQIRGLDLRGLYARATLDDVAALNAALGLRGSRSIGEVMVGGYVQAGYNVLSQTRSSVSLAPYYRFERTDTQARVPGGFARDPAQNGTYHTLGVELKPIAGVAVKADYQRMANRARTGVSQFNISLGYAF